MKHLTFALIATLGLSLAMPALAQDSAPAAKDLMPPVTEKSTGESQQALDHETHPPLRLTPDKSQLIRLDKQAGSVVVGNPAHLTVLLDTPTLAVAVPRQPGATHMTIVDKEGNVIMQRHVIVASPKENYVRVRRSCANAGNSRTPCQPTSVYFCPDMCHEIQAGTEGRTR
jgi:Flp pilus assembly secretin CpaC